MTEELQLIGTFPDEQSAILASAILEANGIASIVSADAAGSMEPHLQFARGTQMSVRREDAEAALELLSSD